MSLPTLCGNNIPLLTGCPADTEWLMFFNVPGTPNGVAMRTWESVRCCWTQQQFGGGIQTFSGSQLDGSGIIMLDGLTNNMLLFARNVPNFLLDPSQWALILDADTGEAVGIQVKIGYEDDDTFIAFPNPTCIAPASVLPDDFSGLNETIGGSGVDQYIVSFTNARKVRFGTSLSIQVYANDGSGTFYLQNVPIVVDDPDNPSTYTVFNLTGLDWRIVLT